VIAQQERMLWGTTPFGKRYAL